MGVQYPRISHPQCLFGPVETSHERGRHSFPGLALYNLSVFVEPNQGRGELSIPDLNSQGLNRPPEAGPEKGWLSILDLEPRACPGLGIPS